MFYNYESDKKYLYHYTSSTTLVKHILPTGMIRFSPLSKTNDPRESKDWTFGFGVNHNSSAFNKLDGKDFILLENRATFIAKGTCKLLCLTMDELGCHIPDIDVIYKRGYCRPRMWAHYAENHNGICLIFDKIRLNEVIENSKRNESVLYTGEVKYNNRSQAPSLYNNPFIINYDEVLEFGMEIAVHRHIAYYHKELFFEKSVDWKEEREYRWVIREIDAADFFVEIKDSLKGIILGPNFSDKLFEKIEKYNDNYSYTIGQLRWKNGVPEMIPRFHPKKTVKQYLFLDNAKDFMKKLLYRNKNLYKT